MSGVDPETADSAAEQVLSAYKDCVRVLGRDLLVELKSLMPNVLDTDGLSLPSQVPPQWNPRSPAPPRAGLLFARWVGETGDRSAPGAGD
jgi:hypothetical protein